MNSSAVNEKYKTQRCRHFDMQGRCDLGEKCHFAHGDQELRKMSDVSSCASLFRCLKWWWRSGILISFCSLFLTRRSLWQTKRSFTSRRQTIVRARASLEDHNSSPMVEMQAIRSSSLQVVSTKIETLIVSQEDLEVVAPRWSISTSQKVHKRLKRAMKPSQ